MLNDTIIVYITPDDNYEPYTADDFETWDEGRYIEPEDPWDLEVGFDPYGGCYGWDC